MVLSRLDKRWLQAASHDLCKRLSEIVDSKLDRPIKHILAWVSFFPGELDLTPFITDQMFKRQVYLPRVVGERAMTFIALKDDWMTKIEPGAYGVPGPKDSQNVYEPGFADETLVIVPGLAFDQEGNRLGRGKGYYSNFLRPPMSRAVKIGACWSLQLVSTLPSTSDHVLIDWVCHERGAIQTGAKFEEDTL